MTCFNLDPMVLNFNTFHLNMHPKRYITYIHLNINIFLVFEFMINFLTNIGGRGSFCFKDNVLLFTTKIYYLDKKKCFKMLRNVHAILTFSLMKFGVITYSQATAL